MAAPVALVKWTKVPAYLNQVISDGITSVVLMQKDGSVLSVAGDEHDTERIIGGVIANAWNTLHEETEAIFDRGQEGARFMLVDCDTGRILACPLGSFYLALYARRPVPFGLLMEKVIQRTQTLTL